MADTRTKLLIELGSFAVDPQQKARFATGELCQAWQRRYSQLFDVDDRRLAASQPQYHFYEWLAAILIYETSGWLSLVEQYEFPNIFPRPHEPAASHG